MLLRQLLILIVLIPVSVGVYAADVLSIDDVVGNAGESDIPCFIHATHDLDIEGFSVAIQHDPSIVTMTSADFQDTAVATLLGGGDPDFAGLTSTASVESCKRVSSSHTAAWAYHPRLFRPLPHPPTA